MFFKQIFRNWLPFVHFFLGVFMFLFFNLLLFFYHESKLDWRIFTMGAITLNILNIGFYSFGFSFDYYILLNCRDRKLIKKYLNKQFIRILISILLGSLIVFTLNKISENILRIVLCAMCLIPIQILCYIVLFRKINLYDNKFTIIKQTAINYFVPMIQVVLIILFYLLCNDMTYAIILLLVIHITFFYKLDYIVAVFIKKINYEYTGNRQS